MWEAVPAPTGSLSIAQSRGGFLRRRRGSCSLCMMDQSIKLPEAPESIMAERLKGWFRVISELEKIWVA